jgi:hypothetical protein
MVFGEVSIMVGLYALYVFVVSQWSKRLHYNVDEEVFDEIVEETKKHPIHVVTHKILSYIPMKYYHPMLPYIIIKL